MRLAPSEVIAPDALLADHDYQIKAYVFGAPELPSVMFIDTSTMHIVSVHTPISQDAMEFEVERAFAYIDGTPVPRTPLPTLVDGRFTNDQWEMIQAMATVPAPPADPTNAHADDPAAASLGRDLFGDMRLSPSGTQSCAMCHMASRSFTDGLPTGMGISTGDRNTPTALFTAHNRWLFWDGRADSQWAQALGPPENPGEMNSSRLFIAHVIADHYAAQYEAIFGPLPPLADTTRFPAAGRPGDSTYDGMTAADQNAVTRVYVNVGKSIEAFERTLTFPETAFDRYARGDFNAMSVAARDGLEQFAYDGCIGCHYGPMLTDDSFHNIGMPTGRRDGAPDRGRIDAIAQLLASPFRSDGPLSDAPRPSPIVDAVVDPEMLGQFHTPTLRGVALTGPWGHGGTFTDLESVIIHYATRATMAPDPTSAGHADIHLPGFHRDAEYVSHFVALLRAMSAP
jgi:cytochrome c peroxidase